MWDMKFYLITRQTRRVGVHTGGNRTGKSR